VSLPPLEISPGRARIYGAEVLAQLPRLLSLQDREPASRTYGCFDRDHWSWKFRDLPLGMMQTAAYPLALLWRMPLEGNSCFANARALEWIDAAIGFALAGQHRNGSFDAFAPNEQDIGPTLGIAHGLSEALLLVREALPEARVARALDALRRAWDFALPRDEEHGFISNHRALFAVALQDAFALTGDARYQRRAAQLVHGILERQSPDGWYEEYGGADPGYESLGIFHLATYWRRTGDARLLGSLERAVEFYAHCVHPDGSVGGVYGSRHTSLYFPGGFELLSSRLPMARAVARFMRGRLSRRNVVTPAAADPENLIPLAYAYLEGIRTEETDGVPAPPLPCESLDGIRYYSGATLAVAGAPHYYAVVSQAKGGACRIFDKKGRRVAYEDAGYLVSTQGASYTSQLASTPVEAAPPTGRELACASLLTEVRQELPTPFRFLVLRLLNLTAFRSRVLGGWLRRWIVARLMSSRRAGPFRLERRFSFDAEGVRVRDRLERLRAVGVTAVALPRSFTAIHMGSAKYWHPAELDATPQVPVGHMATALDREGAASMEFRLWFGDGGPPALVVGGAEPESLFTRSEVVPHDDLRSAPRV
jgi:hypothetical protein